jgi:hypothetical protein
MKRGTLPVALPASLLASALLGGSALVRAEEAPALRIEAQPARLFLDYERGPGAAECLAPRELATAVEQRLGRAVFVTAADAEIQARVRAQRVGRGFSIEVELRGRDAGSLGHRRLRTGARHCSALDDALTLVVSLAADVSTSPVGAAPRSAPLVPLETAIEVPVSTFAPRLGWHARPSLGVIAVSGLLPALGAGLAIELELRPPRLWPLWLRATDWHGQRMLAGASGAAFSAQTLEIGVCPWTFEWERIGSRSCVEQLLGRVHAEGLGFDLPQSGASATLALGATENLSLRFGDWFVSVSGTLLAPLIQRRYFYVDGDEITLHDQAWVWGLAELSLGFEL